MVRVGKNGGAEEDNCRAQAEFFWRKRGKLQQTRGILVAQRGKSAVYKGYSCGAKGGNCGVSR